MFSYAPVLMLTATLAIVASQHIGPAVYDPPAQNFTQTLNHGSNDSQTFKQLYQIDTTYFKPGRPILFHQSEEAYMTPLKDQVLYNYASELGAISCVLEHRFFGSSFPEGVDPQNVTTAEYKPLTLDNILQDGVEFVNWIRKTVPGAERSPVVYFSNSYGGFLAIQARIRHPDTFAGSLAFSPLTAGFGRTQTLQENPYKNAVSDFVANLYWDVNGVAAHKMQQAFKDITNCSAINSCATAMPELNLCDQPSTDDEWAYLIQGLLVTTYSVIPQLNFDAAVFEPAYQFQKLVNATANAASSGAVLRIPIDMMNNIDPSDQANYTDYTKKNCADWKSKSGQGSTNDQLGVGPAFNYISCTFLIGSESSVASNNSIFPPFLVDTPASSCEEGGQAAEWRDEVNYNKTNEEWQEMYNLTDAALDQVTNLLIMHGTFDRTMALGMPNLTPSNDRSHSKVLVTSGLGHMESAYSYEKVPRGLNRQLDEARDQQLSYIRGWFDIWDQAEDASSGDGTGNNGSDGVPESFAPGSTTSHSALLTVGVVAIITAFGLL